MPKAGRPKKYTVDYFPHDIKEDKAVKILEHRFGPEGYAGYYKLRELIGDTEMHKPGFKSAEDRYYALHRTSLSEETFLEMIKILVKIGRVDKELWQNEKVIWMDDFVKRLDPVYYKRGKGVPKKDGSIESIGVSDTGNSITDTRNSITDTRNSEERKGKNSVANKSKGEESNNPHPSIDLSSLIGEYKDIDVNRSYEKYLSYHDNPSEKSFRRWLDKDRKNGLNKKRKVFRHTLTGYIIAYCKKCGEKHLPNNEFQLREGSPCCGAELVPDKPQLPNKELTGGVKFQNLTNEVK